MTWGINPGQSVGISQKLPAAADVRADDRASVAEALEFMSFQGGMPIAGTKIDVAFIGSCTNGRISDLREAARIVKGPARGARRVKALVVPGSQSVRKAAEAEGLDKIFTEAGFEWRGAGCSMCLAMNPDQLQGRQICASSSNRNFKGRQGSPTGRTLLMSPAMVAAAAIAGEVVDVRRILQPRRGARVMTTSRFVDQDRRARRSAARPRHRHRPHHPGAVSEMRQLRRARNARLRRRPQAAGRARADACVLESALSRARASCW